MTMPPELKAILRRDLVSFIRKVFDTVAPGEPYIANWHIEAIAAQLEAVINGDTRRQIINLPPRTLKSVAISVAQSAFLLGQDPATKIICVSYSQELASELHRQFRMVVEASWFRELFPGFAIKRDRDLELVTSKGGSRFATSVGATLTGRGADHIIIDDPLKAEEALSDASRNRVNIWFSNTLATRLNDPARGRIIVVAQRLHEEDLCGHLLQKGGWHHLNLPAVAPETCEVPLGHGRAHRWKQGEPLDACRLPHEQLNRIKAEIGSLNYSAQYLQSPVPVEGNIVKRQWIKWYDQVPERRPGDQIVQSWDIASTISDSGDWTVCTTWLKRGNDYYLLNVLRGRWEFPEVRRRIVEHARDHGAKVVLIEKAGPGLNMVQELRSLNLIGSPRPIGVVPLGSKPDRMAVASCRIEAGQVWMPRDAPWLSILLNELLAFPNGRHDDQVDSISQFLNWAQNRPRPQVISMFGGEVITGE